MSSEQEKQRNLRNLVTRALDQDTAREVKGGISFNFAKITSFD